MLLLRVFLNLGGMMFVVCMVLVLVSFSSVL